MESLLVFGGLVAALGAFVAAGMAVSGKSPHLLLAVVGDEDVKIASGSFSPSPTAEDSAQAEAELYLRQKRVGNIDRARELGEDYAGALIEWAAGRDTADDELGRQRFHHQLVLYSYGVNRVIAEQSPNSILAQTSLNVFYDAVENAAPVISAHIKDMAAFSLYILVDRSRNRSEEEIGRIYAQLCGADGERALIEEGDRVYRESCEAAALRMEQTEYDDDV